MSVIDFGEAKKRFSFRLQQVKALQVLFERKHGRPATSPRELEEWAYHLVTTPINPFDVLTEQRIAETIQSRPRDRQQG